MTLRTFHTSGAAELGDSPTVVKSTVDGIVSIDKTTSVNIVKIGDHEYYAHKPATIVVKDGEKVVSGIPLISYVNAIKQEDVTNKVPILEIYFEV